MHVEILEGIKEQIKQDHLLSFAKALHDNYQPFLTDMQVWGLLEKVFPHDVYNSVLEPYKENLVGHQLVNDIVMSTYYGEKKVKYHFAKKYLLREDEISVFEMNVGTSRLDYARINGHSYAYEIKTELDSLEKLTKQIEDYSKVFEYVNVITHPCYFEKVKKLVPDYCGILTYNPQPNDCKFYARQKRTLNNSYNQKSQLSIMTLRELDSLLKKHGFKNEFTDRKSREETLLVQLSKEQINKDFKLIVKKRFEKRWKHLCVNFEKIQPIDMQSFFKSLVNPKWVYYKNSSNV